MSFVQNFPKRQYGLNCIVVWSKFSKKTKWIKPYSLLLTTFQNEYSLESNCLLIKRFLKGRMSWVLLLSFYQHFQLRHMSWTILPLDQNFLKRQYDLNRIVFWLKFHKKLYRLSTLPFDQSLLKRQYELDYVDSTVWSFDQKLLKIYIYIYIYICIKPHYLFTNILLKDTIDPTVLSFGQNFVQRQRGLDHIVFWSNVS